MISEVANAVFLTYCGTEYLLQTNIDGYRPNWKKRLLSQPTYLLTLAAVAVLNVIDHVSGTASFVNELLQDLFHVPKAVFAAIAYVSALYVDCRRVTPQLSLVRDFLPKVGWAFLRVLPVYPFVSFYVIKDDYKVTAKWSEGVFLLSSLIYMIF